MQRKHFIFTGIAVLLLVGLVYFILSRPKGKAYEEIDTIMGVPINSELIIHIPDVESFVENSEDEGTWKNLNHWGIFKDFKKFRKEVTEALSETEIKELIDNSQLTIATKIAGRSGIEISYIFPLKTENRKQTTEKLVQYFAKNLTQSSQKYSGFQLYRLNDKNSDNSYFYTFTKGLFILSTSRIPVEDALLQISNNNSLLDKNSFQELKKIASKNDDINIFINGKYFPKLLALGLDGKYNRFIRELTDFTTQAGIDVNIKENAILMNGFLYSNTDDFFYTNILLNQEPTTIQIEEIIPAETRFWAALTLSDENTYLDNYKRYLEQTGDMKAYRKFSSEFQKQTNISPEKLIYPNMDSEVGLVISEDNILGESANRYCVMRTKSKSEMEKVLDKMRANYEKKTQQKLPTFTHKLDGELYYTIYTFPSSDFAHMLWGGLFYETQTNFCTLLDNYLVFASTKESLKNYINHIVRRKTLEHDDFYQSQKKFWVDDKATFTAYVRTGDGSFFKPFAKDKLKTEIEDKTRQLEKFPSASIQIKNLKNKLYLNGYVSYAKSIKKAPETVWQSRLDNPLQMKPVMVTNHKSKDRELIFQDTKNIVYLISNEGHILWKLPLNEPILGTIHQVDCYKNNKLQYLFNTASKLYLVDRNGNNVSNFPINFRAKATNGIAVFDYDRNKNYRIFIACEDKKTYLYDISGKINQGWEADKNEDQVKQPIQHFVNGNRDYIVYNDGYRNYILNRRGKVRVLPKQNFEKAPKSSLVVLPQTSQQKCSIVATDKAGTIHFTHLDGSVTTKKIADFSENHIFSSYDLTTNGSNEFIFIDKGKLQVFTQSGTKLFDYDFDTEDISSPNFYTFATNDKKIGLRAGKKIYLFSSDGSIYDGFPLEGYSDFSIGFMSKTDLQFNLFVAGNKDLLYNYIVQ